MAIKSLDIKIHSVRWTDDPRGDSDSITKDHANGYRYIVIQKDTDIEARDDANADLAQVDGKDVVDCTHLFLEVLEDDHETAALLIQLRKIINDETGAQNGPFIMIKNLDDSKVEWDTKIANYLKIKRVSLDDIVIDDMDNTVGAEPKISGVDAGDRLGNDLSEWRKGFFEVADLVKKGYDDYKNIPVGTDLDKEIAILADCLDTTTTGHATVINTLTTQQGTKATAEANDRRLIRQFVYWLSKNKGKNDTANARNWKGKIELFNLRLRELKLWKEVVGLDSIEEVLKFNAAGFNIRGNNRADATTAGSITDANPLNYGVQSGHTKGATAYNVDIFGTWKTVKDFFPNPNKSYRGYEILKDTENLSVEHDGNNDDDNHFFGWKGSAAAEFIFTKDNIDHFLEGTVAESFGGDAKYKGKTDPKELRGFQPGDIQTGGTNTTNGNFNVTDTIKIVVAKEYKDKAGGGTVNGTEDKYEYKDLTKICFDLLDSAINYAGDLNRLMSIIVDGADFEEVGSSKSAADLLEMYWNVIKSQNATNLIDTGVNYDEAERLRIIYDDGASGSGADKEKIKNLKRLNAAYDHLKEFVDDYFGTEPTYKEDLDAWEQKLNKFMDTDATNAFEKAFNIEWNGRVRKKISRVRAVANDKPDNKNVTETEINAVRDAIKSENGAEFLKKLKAVFDDSENQTELKKHPKAFLDDLKTLVGIIDKAYKNGKDVLKSSLEAYSGGDDDKKTLWAMVNRIKDDKDKELGKEALSKATKTGDDDEAKKLAAHKTKIKGELEAILTGAGAIIGDTLTTKEMVDKAKKIFDDCKKAWEKGGYEGTLETTLNGYKESDKTEWKAVDSFKKNAKNETCNEGFATGALNALKKHQQDDKKALDEVKIKQVNSEASANKAIEDLKKSERYRNNTAFKEKAEQIRIPRLKLIGALFKKGGAKEKEMAELIRDSFIAETKLETDYAVSEHATALTGLKEKLTKLKEFEGGDSYKGLGSTEKSAFDLLVKNLGEKVQAMEIEANESGDNKPPKEPGFWGGWKGILLIIVIVLVVLGAIAWLIKANSSEEGEGEVEE